jgi:hypothetical protein
MAVKSREQWLIEAEKALRVEVFKPAGVDKELPKRLRVSVGWPGGRGPKRDTIGQCWSGKVVEDGMPAAFISPVLKDPVRILDVLAHEMVHSMERMGHRKQFSEIAAKIGLVKPWKATTASPELVKTLKRIARKLGKYDHAPIAQSAMIRQATRLLKVVCPVDGYTIRVTEKWLTGMGFTTCPCGEEMVRG